MQSDFLIGYVLERSASEPLAVRRQLYRGLADLPGVTNSLRETFLAAAERLEAVDSLHRSMCAEMAKQGEFAISFTPSNARIIE